MNSSKVCRLEDLETGLPGLTPRWGCFLAEASLYCFDINKHSSGVILQVDGTFKAGVKLEWSSSVTDQTRRSWSDLQECTEYGASGVAILLVLGLTQYTVIHRSRKGPGFDYWLGNKQDVAPFQNAARLEVSGILNGGEKEIKSRVNLKKKQTEKSDGTLPAYIAVIEFSQPASRLVKK